jgi:hypothetical protein
MREIADGEGLLCYKQVDRTTLYGTEGDLLLTDFTATPFCLFPDMYARGPGAGQSFHAPRDYSLARSLAHQHGLVFLKRFQ